MKHAAAILLCLLSHSVYADGLSGTVSPQLGGGISNSFDGGINKGGVPSWVKPGAVIDLDFANGRYYGCTLPSCLSITRASSKTNLLPSSVSGFAYTTFGNNTLAITSGSGLLIEEARTNQLLNSAAPATQTTGSLGTGTYTLWINGSGSATMSLGTGVGCGTGSATNGTPVNFTITVAGTCIVTVSGSLNFEQLELGAFGTSGIVTAGSTATRAVDMVLATGKLLSALNGAAGAIFAQTILVSNPISNNPRILGFTAPPSYQNYLNFQSTGKIVQYNGSVVVTTTNSVTPSALTKSGFSWAASNRIIAANNVTAATSATSPGLSGNGTPELGSSFPSDAGSVLDGYISRLTVYNAALTAAQVQAGTQ